MKKKNNRKLTPNVERLVTMTNKSKPTTLTFFFFFIFFVLENCIQRLLTVVDIGRNEVNVK